MESGEAVSVQPAVSLHGFQFHSRCQRIDWRKIAAVDIDKVAREVDVDTLQNNINHLTYCDIETELEGTTVDPNFLKLFKLAQLSIEFLIHSQESLLQSLSEAEEQLTEANRNLEEERKFRICDQEAIKQLQRENRKRRRIIENQQLEMLHGDKLARSGAPCPYCHKIFLSLPYLQAHVVRRHPGQTAPTEDVVLTSWDGVPGNEVQGSSISIPLDLQKDMQELRSLLQSERTEVLKLTTQLQNIPLQLDGVISLEGLQKSKDHSSTQDDAEKERLLYELESLTQKYNELAQAARHSPFTATEGAAQELGPACHRLKTAVTCEKEVQTIAVLSGTTAVEAQLSRQLERQRFEMTQLLTKQELAFQEKVNALSRDMVCLSKTSMNLERKLSELEAERPQPRLPTREANNLCLSGNRGTRLIHGGGAGRTALLGTPLSDASAISALRSPQGTVSGPVPVPRQKAIFHGKSQRKPSAYLPVRRESSVHARQSSSFKGSIKNDKQPQTRQFLFDNKTMQERMKSAVRSTPNLIDALKEEIMDLTKNKLSSMGVNLQDGSVTNTLFRDCSKKLRSERKLLAKKNINFFDLRNRADRQADGAATRLTTEGSASAAWLREGIPSQQSFHTSPESIAPPCETKHSSGTSNASSTSSDEDGASVSERNRGSAAVGSSMPHPYAVCSKSKPPAQQLLSPEFTKPLISSDEDEENQGQNKAVARLVAANCRKPPEARSRPPTRISDLVQSIESQLLKRTSRPPTGSIDTVEFKEVVPVSLHAGDHRIQLPLLKKAGRGVTPSSGAATKGGSSPSQNYSDDDDVSLEEVN